MANSIDPDSISVAPPAGKSVRVKRPGERRSVSRSATRALDVLELFGQVRRPLRAIEIARALELHTSTADQLLKTMMESAHLTFDAVGKTYLPSPRLARFGGWMVESYGGDGRLRSLLRHVQQASGATVTLTTPNDLFMQVIDFADPTNTPDGAERGLRVSLFGTAVGAAYLSTLGDREIRRLAERARLADGEQDTILTMVNHVRRNGFAESPSADGDIWSLAIALPGDLSPAALVLGIAGAAPVVRENLVNLRSLLREAISNIGTH